MRRFILKRPNIITCRTLLWLQHDKCQNLPLTPETVCAATDRQGTESWLGHRFTSPLRGEVNDLLVHIHLRSDQPVRPGRIDDEAMAQHGHLSLGGHPPLKDETAVDKRSEG
jgi:hypothetical protein